MRTDTRWELDFVVDQDLALRGARRRRVSILKIGGTVAGAEAEIGAARRGDVDVASFQCIGEPPLDIARAL